MGASQIEQYKKIDALLKKIKKLTEVRTCVIVKAGLFCQLFYVSIILPADDAL